MRYTAWWVPMGMVMLLASGCGERPGNSGGSGTSPEEGGTSSASENQSSPPSPAPTISERTVTVSTSGGGTVGSSPAGIECGTTCTARFASGREVVLTAVPSTGSLFERWEGACTGTGVCALGSSGDAEARAVFVRLRESDAECSALMPGHLGEGIAALLPQGNEFHSGVCHSGTSDMRGTLALGWAYDGGPEMPGARFFAVTGQTASMVGNGVGGNDEGAFAVLGQPSGFLVYTSTEVAERRDLRAFSHDGALLRTQPVSRPPEPFFGPSTSVKGAPDPSGGIAIVRQYLDPQTPGTVPRRSTYQRYESDALASMGELELGRDLRVLAVGVSSRANVLVIVAPSISAEPYQARWLSRDGAPLTEWFAVDVGQGHLTPLVEGGLLLSVGPRKEHLRFFRELQPRAEDAPSWLRERPGALIVPIRGGVDTRRQSAPAAAAGSRYSPPAAAPAVA